LKWKEGALNRKFENRYTISLNVERELYCRFVDGLPRSVSVSDEFKEFMKERVRDMEEDKEKEKERKACVDKSPIRIHEYSDGNTISTLIEVTESKLDIYGSQSHLVEYVNSITDSKKAWALKRNARLLDSLADTKAKKLMKDHK
jgi:hypothetical protein